MPRTKHIINVHTSTGTTEPSSANMYLGEIAVQHTPNDPALWIKVGNNESSTTYEKFIGETEILNIINSNNILGSGYTYSGLPYVNSATSIADAYSALTYEVLESEEVAAAALNDLNDRVIELSGSINDIHVDMILGSGYTYSGLSYINSATSIADAYSALTKEMFDNEKVVAASLNNLNDRIGGVLTIETNGEVAGRYSPSANTLISFDFVWDDSLGSGYTYSGLPYVNSATSIADAYSAITHEVLAVEEVVAAALNDLNDRVIELSGSVENIHVDMILGSGYTYSGLPYITSASSIADAFSALTSEMLLDEKVVSEAFNDLNTRVIELSGNTSILEPLSGSVLSLSGVVESTNENVEVVSATVISLSAAVKSKEYVTAAAINDLDRRIEELSGNTGGGGGGDITPLSSATYSHVTNNDIHVTAQDKSTWNGKQDAISNLSTIISNAASGMEAYNRVNALSAATTAVAAASDSVSLSCSSIFTSLVT